VEIIDNNFDSNIRPLSFGPLIQQTYIFRLFTDWKWWWQHGLSVCLYSVWYKLYKLASGSRPRKEDKL